MIWAGLFAELICLVLTNLALGAFDVKVLHILGAPIFIAVARSRRVVHL